MNSRSFSRGYEEAHPAESGAPSILGQSSIKRNLGQPRKWAETFNFYAMDALHDDGLVTAHEQDHIESFLANYGSEQAQRSQAVVSEKMMARSLENPAFGVLVDELHFHSINRAFTDQWRALLFGLDQTPSTLKIRVTQELLAIKGMQLLATRRKLIERNRRLGFISSAVELATDHATQIDTAIALLEYQKLKAAEAGCVETVIVPAPPRFRYGTPMARRAHFLVVNVPEGAVRGVRSGPDLTDGKALEQEFDRHYITPVDGILDLGNFTASNTPSDDKGDTALRLSPEPGLLSVGYLLEHDQLNIAAASRTEAFASLENLDALITAKKAAHETAVAMPRHDFSHRTVDAAQRIQGRIDAELRKDPRNTKFDT